MRWRQYITLALALFATARSPAGESPPSYTSDGIVNAATQTTGALAPNTIATIYGSNLSFTTCAAKTAGTPGGLLPDSIDGVSVLVNGMAARLFFISPGQINFLIPYELAPGRTTIAVARQGLAGPVVPVQINSTSPGLFAVGGGYAVAAHLNGSLVAAESPAQANEIVVVYAAGLGWTSPPTISGKLATGAASVLPAVQMQVLLDGKAVAPANVLYAGLAPGYAGLYQINLKLPATLSANPEIRISAGNQMSPALVQLATAGSQPAPNAGPSSESAQ